MDFTKLECREILAHVDVEIDEDVLAKLQEGAKQKRIAMSPGLLLPHSTAEIVHMRDKLSIEAAKALEVRSVNPDDAVRDGTGKAVLTERLIKDGWTQADCDIINEQARIALEQQTRMQKNYRPIVGEANASNIAAAFAEPDIAPAPKDHPDVGRANRFGHVCVRYDGDQAVFRCDAGHGYTYNPAVGGCPICFLNGGASTETDHVHDQDAIEGEESAW